jgi:oligogalacturonide transport system substrate-binding protein
MKRIIALSMMLVLTFMVGCSGSNNQPTNTSQQDSKKTIENEQITIRMSWWGGDSRHQATIKAIELFQEKNPNIKVLPEYTAWDGHYEKIATQLLGKTEADLMQINYNWFYVFSPDGEGFYDLTKLENLDLSQWDSAALEPLTMNGVVQGVPISIGSRVFYFNKTTFDQAGIDIPTTWDELINAGNVFKEKLGDEYYPLGNISTTDALSLLIFNYVSQQTGKPIVNENNQLAYTEEELTKGFEMLEQLLENHVMPYPQDDSALKDAKNTRWIDGKYAGVFEWNSSIAQFTGTLNPNNNPNIVLAPYLTQPNQKASGAFSKITMGFAISKNSKNPEAAAAFLDFMFTDSDAVEAIGLERAVPVHKKAEQILNEKGLLEGLQYEGHVLSQETESFPYHPYYEDAEVKAAYFDVIEKFLYGQLVPSEAANQLITNFNIAIKTAMER